MLRKEERKPFMIIGKRSEGGDVEPGGAPMFRAGTYCGKRLLWQEHLSTDEIISRTRAARRGGLDVRVVGNPENRRGGC
jgi:hypothetical protein